MSNNKVTASGGFHNSGDITILVKDGSLSAGQYRRLANHFCGIKNCVCGGVARAEISGANRREFLEMVENASYTAYSN